MKTFPDQHTHQLTVDELIELKSFIENLPSNIQVPGNILKILSKLSIEIKNNNSLYIEAESAVETYETQKKISEDSEAEISVPDIETMSFDTSKIIDVSKIEFLQDIQSPEDIRFFIELIDIYIVELPKTISNIINAIRHNDMQQLKFHSHKLRGSSLTLGITEVSDISLKLETAAKEGNMNSECKKNVEDLVHKFEIIIRDLEIIKEKYSNLQ